MKHRTTTKRPSAGLGLWLLAAALGLGTWYQTDHLAQLRSRMEEVESGKALRAALRNEVDGMRTELTGMRQELASASAGADETRRLVDRVSEVGRAVEAQGDHIAALEEAQARFDPDAMRRELEEREDKLRQDWALLNDRVGEAHELASESSRRVEAIAGRDEDDMWHRLVGPVVQLAGDTSVGSGVLLRSHEDLESGGYRTYLLTAWHVVRDIQGDLSRRHVPVPTAVYAMDGSIRNEEANLLVFDAELDAALLELVTPDPLPNGADLAPPSRLASVHIFDPVYAVGCPLGNDPIPTFGEISTNHHTVDGELYWMINAPTYIGNSGGGIFDSDTFELLGIFSKIYTHGSLRPTIVPHMGLVTPLSKIYEWLEKVGYGHIIPGSSANEARADLEVAGG